MVTIIKQKIYHVRVKCNLNQNKNNYYTSANKNNNKLDAQLKKENEYSNLLVFRISVIKIKIIKIK